MKINKLIDKINQLKNVEDKIKKRKDCLRDLRYPIGSHTLKVGYDSEVGYMTTNLDFTTDETKKILQDSIVNLEKEKISLINELNGNVIEIDEDYNINNNNKNIC